MTPDLFIYSRFTDGLVGRADWSVGRIDRSGGLVGRVSRQEFMERGRLVRWRG